MDLNKVMIIGRLTRDPELRTITDGTPVANFGMATNTVYTDKAGVRQEKVEYHELVVWRRLAEIASQYLRKGAKAYIEGKLQTRSWDDPTGIKRYKTEIVVENLIMLDRPPSVSGGTYAAAAPQWQAQNAFTPTPGAPRATEQPPEEESQGFTAVSKKPKSAPPLEEELPTIDITEEVKPSTPLRQDYGGSPTNDEEEISVEDIPF